MTNSLLAARPTAQSIRRTQLGFERIFQLADFVQVKNASLENGLLHVDLVREIPEAKKPRSIPINSGAQAPQVVDASVAA